MCVISGPGVSYLQVPVTEETGIKRVDAVSIGCLSPVAGGFHITHIHIHVRMHMCMCIYMLIYKFVKIYTYIETRMFSLADPYGVHPEMGSE